MLSASILTVLSLVISMLKGYTFYSIVHITNEYNKGELTV